MDNETIGFCKECGIAVTEENLHSKFPKVVCKNCHDAEEQKKEEEKEKALRTDEYNRSRMRSRRNLSWIFGGVVALIVLVLFIVNSFNSPVFGTSTANIVGGLVVSYVLFAFVASLFFDGVVRDVLFWMAERTVQFPGLIFSLDLDGILWYISVKLLFGILGFLAGVLFAILGVLVAMIISPFTYPFTLIHQQRCIKNADIADFD